MKKKFSDADPATPKGKQRLIKGFTPPSPIHRNIPLAFLWGGGMCAAGEAIRQRLVTAGVTEDDSFLYISLGVITLAALATALGIFDRLVRYAGAGLLVPISGFSNSIVSSSIDAKSEGRIVGVGSALFTVSGPVIVWGLTFGALYGAAYYLSGMLAR